MMAPLKLGYCHQKDGKVNDRHLNFYAARSKHVGGIAFEPFYIDAGLRENPFQLGLDADYKIEGIRNLVELLHRTNTKAIEKMVAAAQRAEMAGVDFIEIQFGYGYLMSQFLSAAINQRADKYGGSLENRMRFPLLVFNTIKAAINIPVIARISADDLLPGGIKTDEAILFSKELIKSGVVALHVTAGSACTSPAWFYQHMFIPKGKNWELAARINEVVSVPVFFHGRIHSKDDITELREKYGASCFSIGRAMVADERFVEKILNGGSENIRPCLACSEGCLGGVRAGKGLSCVVIRLLFLKKTSWEDSLFWLLCHQTKAASAKW